MTNDSSKLVHIFSRGTDASVTLLASSVSIGAIDRIALTRLSQMPPARKSSPVWSIVNSPWSMVDCL